jgi:ABC-type branched-subunit amino acid transport system substrate-binding protein
MPTDELFSRIRRWAGVSLLAAAPLFAGCASSSSDADDSITIGLLLPFTGTNSATTNNFERAVLFAADRINAGGGIGGRRLRIVSKDTHSDFSRAQSSLKELIAEHAVVVMGPESADIAAEIAPTLAAQGVAFLSPLVGAADDDVVDCDVPWFRLAPSARSLGDALAKRLAAEDAGHVAILYEARAYDQALRSAVSKRFKTLGGSVVLEIKLDPDAQSYAGTISSALEANADAVVLATSPRTAALVVNEYDALSPKKPRWFLSPLLKTELLVENVAPEALDGAIGVAPKIYDQSTAFPDAFAQRWQGDQPLEGAYFYYDAIGLLALALERTVLTSGGEIELSSLNAAVLQSAATRGESVGWNELETGVERLTEGSDVYYSGLTGPMLLNSCGPRALGASSVWRVHSSAIINDE